MLRRRIVLSIWGLLLVVPTCAAAAITTRPAGPQVRISAASARSGTRVTIRGAAWQTTGCSPVVRLRAYVAGVSPYPTIVLPSASVKDDGTFTRIWKTPAVKDRLQWTVGAEQRCPAPTVRYATIILG